MRLTVRETLELPTVEAARELLGRELLFETIRGTVGGYIVETEAYCGQLDQASHTFRGETPRNASMFAMAGTIYVYFTYGMHYCLNIVTGAAGVGEAVLIRAIEPSQGIEQLRARRQTITNIQLTNGPAKLVQALGVTKAHNGTSIWAGPLRLGEGKAILAADIVSGPRVGIKQAIDNPWRFYIRGNPYVSSHKSARR